MSKRLPVSNEEIGEINDNDKDYFFMVDTFNNAARECDATPHDVLRAAYHVYMAEYNLNAMVNNKNMHVRPSELRKRKQKFKFVN